MAYGDPFTEADVVTKQDLFNKAWDHFVVKGGRKSLRGVTCAYRGAGGAKCAVGVLITDEEARSFEEGVGIGGIPENVVPLRLRPHMEFLMKLQSAHDNATDRAEAFRTNFGNVAAAYKLEIPT